MRRANRAAHLHGHVLRGYFGPLKTRVFILLERLLARATDQILTVSEEQRRELIADFHIAPAAKIRVMHLGLPLEPLLHPADPCVMRAKWGIPAGVPVVGIVARLTAIKGHELFLDMAAELHVRRPDVRFVLIGDGERRAELQAYAAGRDVPVIFGGWEPNSLAPAYYAALDVACLTSFNEGSPVTLIEAMAAGKPVVSTAVGGVPDLVRHGVEGFLVPDRDPVAFAGYVEGLVGDPSLAAEMGRRGRAAAYPKYDVRQLVTGMGELYDELLTPAPKR
jgi:glycosyltransferase involved in cell wall biosynthesis